MKSRCASISDAVKQVHVFALFCAVLGVIILCSIYGAWLQANKKWQRKWQSEIMHARIEQSDDMAEVRKLAEYCRRSADSTYGALVGINKSALILMSAGTCQLVLVSFWLWRISRYGGNCQQALDSSQ